MDLIDTSISHYDITEKIGEGGMGVVYKAHGGRMVIESDHTGSKYIAPLLNRTKMMV